jgi:hypothetical protein
MYAKIDVTGKITGAIDMGNYGLCIVTLVWKKKN